MRLLYKYVFAASVAATTFFSLTATPNSHAQASAFAADYISEPQARGIPKGLIAESKSNPYLIWVSLGSGRLHVLERAKDDQYVEIENISISIGKKVLAKSLRAIRKLQSASIR